MLPQECADEDGFELVLKPPTRGTALRVRRVETPANAMSRS